VGVGRIAGRGPGRGVLVASGGLRGAERQGAREWERRGLWRRLGRAGESRVEARAARGRGELGMLGLVGRLG
jgi:hypothetical protein